MRHGMERVMKLRLASFGIRLPHRTRDDDDDESIAVRYAVPTFLFPFYQHDIICKRFLQIQV